jgi:hypothetical protein
MDKWIAGFWIGVRVVEIPVLVSNLRSPRRRGRTGWNGLALVDKEMVRVAGFPSFSISHSPFCIPVFSFSLEMVIARVSIVDCASIVSSGLSC